MESMTLQVHIEPAPRRRLTEATAFLLAGMGDAPDLSARARQYRDMLQRRPRRSWRLWWARTGPTPCGAAVVIDNPGRTGMVFFSPPGCPGVDAGATASLVRQISLASVQGGLTIVQALVSPHSADELGLLRGAGFTRLANLDSMELDPWLASRQLDAGVAWDCVGLTDRRRLARVVEATYERSLDCPPLAGLRRIEDVLDSHATTGALCPECWWIARLDGIDAGCLLVNETPGIDGQAMEIVYLGVTPAMRGRGLGRQMVRKAAATARGRNAPVLRLAVDSDNVYAVNAYRAEGFRSVLRRVACCMTARDAQVVQEG